MRNINNAMSRIKKSDNPKGKLVLTAILGASLFYYSLSKQPETQVRNTYTNSESIRVEKMTPSSNMESKTEDIESRLELNKEYGIVITDDLKSSPYLMTKNIYDTVQTITSNMTPKEKAEKLFDWIEQFDYREPNDEPYMNAEQVYKQKRGLCAELTYLYIASARSVGLEAEYVRVKKDDSGENVNHACAGVTLDEKLILVDPAYHKFDIKHQLFEEIDDNEATRLYKAWSR